MTIFEPCRSEDQTLLVRGNAFLFPDLCLNTVDGVRRLHLQRKRLSAERLDENTRDARRTGEKLESRFFPNAVVREPATPLDHLAGKNQNLLIGGDTIFVLDLSFDVVNRVRWLDLERTRESLHECLHASTQQNLSVFKLLAGNDKTLLVWGNAIPVSDILLRVIGGV